MSIEEALVDRLGVISRKIVSLEAELAGLEQRTAAVRIEIEEHVAAAQRITDALDDYEPPGPFVVPEKLLDELEAGS